MQDIPYKAPNQAIVKVISRAPIASIVKIPPAKIPTDTYEKLECSSIDKDTVQQIIVILSENGKISLLFQQSELKEMGEQISHLHPLKFLSSIFSNVSMRPRMADVFNDYFKRTAFMEGLGPNLTKEAERGRLDQYIDDFAKEVHVTGAEIRPYFQNRDWEGLVRHLIGE